MMDILTTIAIVLLLLAAVLGLFTGLVWFGFRMGRRTVDRPMAPIVKAKAAATGVIEDPYWEPMYGKQASNTPTVEGR